MVHIPGSVLRGNSGMMNFDMYICIRTSLVSAQSIDKTSGRVDSVANIYILIFLLFPYLLRVFLVVMRCYYCIYAHILCG